MTYANVSERNDLISGLRALADFLTQHPDVPAPLDTVLFVFPPLHGTDQQRRAEIDAIASRVYTRPYETIRAHYTVSRYFGPVEYRAIAIDHGNPADPDGA